LLETERLIVRKPRLDDAEAAFEYLCDPEVMRFIGGETVPREACRDVVQKWLDRWETNGCGHFALERREDGRFLGRVGLIVWDSRTWAHTTLAEAGEGAQPELGWTLAREHWGRGYATEGARAVRDWARRERGLERLISLIHPDNVASQRVAARLGAEPGETVRLLEAGVECVVWVHPPSGDRGYLGQRPAR
jgi:RimJ/RimL family protein N-acetyltransferase